MTAQDFLRQFDVRRFDAPDESRSFEKGRLDLVTIGGLTLGRASYEPGWKWSEHVRPLAGTESCQVAHVGLVLTGRAMVVMDDGESRELAAGDLFAVAPGHDSWVMGDKPYVSIHLMGGQDYAAAPEPRPGGSGKAGGGAPARPDDRP